MNPERERAWLVSLERLALVDEGIDSDSLELVQLAGAVCGTQVAAVGFLGAERHVLRAVVGADVRSIPRAEALCEVPIGSGVALIVSDLLSDEVLRTHPTTVGPLAVRANAGVPVLDEGVAVGTLCVIDSRPRPFTQMQMQVTAPRFPVTSTPSDDLVDDLPTLARIAAGAVQVRLKRYVRPDGAVIRIEVMCTPLHGVDGAVDKVLVHVTDVTDRPQREAELLDEARRDLLTGLPNRTHLLERLAGSPTGVVAYLDLDGFTPVNDAHGHTVGDAVLARLAERMRGALRAGDLLARSGGDEFVAVLGGDLDVASATVQRLRAVVAEPMRTMGTTVRVTISSGLAPIRDGDALAALEAADAAMYAPSGARGPIAPSRLAMAPA